MLRGNEAGGRRLDCGWKRGIPSVSRSPIAFVGEVAGRERAVVALGILCEKCVSRLFLLPDSAHGPVVCFVELHPRRPPMLVVSSVLPRYPADDAVSFWSRSLRPSPPSPRCCRHSSSNVIATAGSSPSDEPRLMAVSADPAAGGGEGAGGGGAPPSCPPGIAPAPFPLLAGSSVLFTSSDGFILPLLPCTEQPPAPTTPLGVWLLLAVMRMVLNDDSERFSCKSASFFSFWFGSEDPLRAHWLSRVRGQKSNSLVNATVLMLKKAKRKDEASGRPASRTLCCSVQLLLSSWTSLCCNRTVLATIMSTKDALLLTSTPRRNAPVAVLMARIVLLVLLLAGR